jgi:putative PIN family toxin of toxin-antitoxin system
VKVVLDTNVLLAAFAAHGLCEAVLEACLSSHEIILSEHILREARRHLTGKFKMPARHVDEIIALLRESSTIVRPARVPADACRDRTDLAVLGTAQAAEADRLITGDGDLLELKMFHATAILSPRAFHDRLC